MYRHQYDSDITIWSPQGRIHQVEYAMEAVNQGYACVGLKSKTHAVICALQRASSELASYQRKIFEIDDHVGISIAGLTADARVLCKFMRTECLTHKYTYGSPIVGSRLLKRVADKSQVNTQRYGRRPYGVGLLVIAHDQNGPHLYESSPSGNYYDFKAQAIGRRSQSCKTYLEKNFEKFESLSLDSLVKHGLRSLREALAREKDKDKEPIELTLKNCSVGIVGEGQKFKILSGDDLRPYILGIDDQDDDEEENTGMDTSS
mmetsp:Transcript_15918/g.17677  ORF Transcript_15918/g.17677 Transcript_15918/m.17677 type:complete len:261 (-) Transcript_15918:91-873(-)